MVKRKPIAEILRAERKKQGYSVSEIAKETGLSQSALNKFFSGQREGVRLEAADILLEFFNLSVVKDPKAK